MDRNKNTNDDYFYIIDEENDLGLDNEGNPITKYTDANFPIDDALFWYDAGE